MPMGYHSMVGDLGSGLSGGQRQRILLARALYKAPAVLALDEATSHLDLHNERAVTEALSRLRITRLVIAHRPQTIAAAQRAVGIRDGAIFDVTIRRRGPNSTVQPHCHQICTAQEMLTGTPEKPTVRERPDQSETNINLNCNQTD